MIDWLTSLRSPAKEAPTVIEEVSRERRLADWDSWFMKKPHWACLMLRFFVQGVSIRDSKANDCNHVIRIWPPQVALSGRVGPNNGIFN